jgi:hypothetical protein
MNTSTAPEEEEEVFITYSSIGLVGDVHKIFLALVFVSISFR